MRGPVVLLALRVTAPAIERIVYRHAGFELGVIVTVDTRQAKRDGEQSSSLGHKVEPIGIGAPHDRREADQRFVRVEAEGLDHDVEGATLAAMAPEYAFVRDVERLGLLLLGDGQHVTGRDEQEAGLRIDEPSDQPGTGDAIDLGPRSCDPPCLAIVMSWRQMDQGNGRQPACRPCGE